MVPVVALSAGKDWPTGDYSVLGGVKNNPKKGNPCDDMNGRRQALATRRLHSGKTLAGRAGEKD